MESPTNLLEGGRKKRRMEGKEEGKEKGKKRRGEKADQ